MVGFFDSDWWYTYPSEQYASQLGLLFPIYGKIKFMFQTTNQVELLLINGHFKVIHVFFYSSKEMAMKKRWAWSMNSKLWGEHMEKHITRF